MILGIPVDTTRLYEGGDPHYVLYLAALVDEVGEAREEIAAELARQNGG